MTSNNFPGDTNSKKLREWLKTFSTTSVIEALSSMKGPTAEALLENLFRFAIEDEDIPTVKCLLQVGINPKGHKCRLSQPYYMTDYEFTPLQLALIRGNTDLALELIRARATIDEPNTGWKSSALVVAIIGDVMRGNKEFWGKDDKNSNDEEFEEFESCEDSTEEHETRDTRYGTDDYLATQEATNRFFSLITTLINAGAAVNLGGIDQVELTRSERDEPRPYFYNSKDVHTPLSAASKYQKKTLLISLLKTVPTLHS